MGSGVTIGFALMVVIVGLGLGEVFRYVPVARDRC